MHAALGEPLRLALAERLLLSDVSPGELSTEMDVATNLLAHHLRVLEGAGLVRRMRSEGDQRRSYLRLRMDDPEVALLMGLSTASASLHGPRVVFVCTHNSARSQLAAAAWTRVSRTPAHSAGTHPAARVHPRAVTAARRHGLALEGARTAQFDDVVRPDDLVVSVCDNAHEELSAGDQRPPLHWAIPDPVPTNTNAAFEAAYEEINQRVDRLASALGTAQHD
jgi:protein-tyrosine-phosphatase/DNA-binding transcriptional ArsR family regulator